MSTSTPASSSPLRDRSNVSLSVATQEDKDQEIQNLKDVIRGMTKTRRRGRKRVRDHSTDDPADAPLASRSKTDSPKVDPSTDYVHYGRIIARFVGPFVSVSHVVDYGLTIDSAMSGDEEENIDEKLFESWKIMWSKFPGFHEYMLKLSSEPVVRRTLCKQACPIFTFALYISDSVQMNAGMERARSDDTSTLKHRILRWVLKNPKEEELSPAIPYSKIKATRGWQHPVLASLLCPLEWPDIQSTYDKIKLGELQLDAKQLPRFLFPIGQQDDETALGNVMKGEVLLRSAKAILMGPDSALECDGFHKGREGNASIIRMTTVTLRAICWVGVQVYFALSSKQEWSKTDGDFDYEEFFWALLALFEDEEATQDIIDLWNKVVFGAVAKPVTDSEITVADSSLTHLEHLKAARAASRLPAASPQQTTTAPAQAAAAPEQSAVPA
ncbi:hypothetical protein B0H10DRAFT_2226386 [Mycena sp. CBHHK59/15]|nr:hypothetical protein B0H10DRAFT_2226386 [Mycena sp. CBHHK59/15]